MAAKLLDTFQPCWGVNIGWCAETCWLNKLLCLVYRVLLGLQVFRNPLDWKVSIKKHRIVQIRSCGDVQLLLLLMELLAETLDAHHSSFIDGQKTSSCPSFVASTPWCPFCSTVEHSECSNLGITALYPFRISLFSTLSSLGEPKNSLTSSGMLHAHVGCPFCKWN